MKVRKIKVTAYRGIRDAEIPIGEGGVIAKGRCESGKTSFLDAIRAALVAQGVAPSDIHHGADKAEIIVEAETLTSAFRIRRGITKNGTTLAVTNGDGFKLTSPQTHLREMLGTSGIDPLDFFLSDDKGRRRIILDASPVTVTIDDVGRWLSADGVAWAGPNHDLPGAQTLPSLDGHGLEALARLRKHFYDQRTEANKAEKIAKEAHTRATAAAAALAGDRADNLDAKAIEDEAERANAALVDVEARQKAAAKAKAASGEARARIAALRAEAEDHAGAAAVCEPPGDEVSAAKATATEAEELVARLRAELEVAESAARIARKQRDDLLREAEIAKAHRRDADAATKRADELEAAIASAAPDVPEAEVASAKAAHVSAQAQIASLDRARKEREARDLAEAASKEADGATAFAGYLDRIVTTLTETAPAELAARGNLIPGFDVERMALDGVPLDTLSGGQKLEFAVRLAKRANPEAKILICDGLERLDPERMETFVRLATDGGWQLLASRVEAGGIQFQAIEP